MPKVFEMKELSSMKSIAGWAFYCAVAQLESWDKAKILDEGGKTVTITFKAGEVDLDFGAVMERLNKAFEREVNRQAQALLQERLNNFQAKVYDLCDRIENCIQDEAARIFPDFKRDNDD